MILLLAGCSSEKTNGQTPSTSQKLELPKKNNLWIFIPAGQSNKAGRAIIEAQDKVQNNTRDLIVGCRLA